MVKLENVAMGAWLTLLFVATFCLGVGVVLLPPPPHPVKRRSEETTKRVEMDFFMTWLQKSFI
jgi:hypothetical protein